MAIGKPSHSTFSIGVDIGATTTRVAGVDPAGRLHHAQRFATPESHNATDFFSTILQTVKRVADRLESEKHVVTNLGFALPATLSRDRSRVVRCINLPFLEPCRPRTPQTTGADRPIRPLPDGRGSVRLVGLRNFLIRQVKKDVRIVTDAEAATWGEYASRKRVPDTFAHLRIGSGVALGIVKGGELLRLDADRSTHPEFLVVDESPDAPPCACGLRGCLELFASGATITRRMKTLGIEGDLKDLETCCTRDDSRARCLMLAAAESIAKAMINVARRFHPQVICLGGGVMERWPSLGEAIRTTIRSIARGHEIETVRLERALAGDDAGVLGAALLARKAPV